MIRSLLIIVALTWLSSSALFSADHLNIIIILVDDQGYYDLGCYGAMEVKTPNIDRLADEGVRFTDYYAAAPICSPSRAGLLTGAYPRRIGMETWVQRADSRRGIHPDEVTLAELFRGHGYATSCVGKWHLDHKPPFLPNARASGATSACSTISTRSRRSTSREGTNPASGEMTRSSRRTSPLPN